MRSFNEIAFSDPVLGATPIRRGRRGGPYPHLTLTSDHLDLAFHAPVVCARRLRQRVAGAPGGTALLLLEAGD
jgi:hypothetical protein